MLYTAAEFLRSLEQADGIAEPGPLQVLPGGCEVVGGAPECSVVPRAGAGEEDRAASTEAPPGEPGAQSLGLCGRCGLDPHCGREG